MKKNGNKWIAIILVIMVIAGISMNMNSNGSAKEEEEDLGGKLKSVTVWLTNKNGKTWDSARSEIEEIINNECGGYGRESIHVHNDETRVYWIEITYQTKDGPVTGRIYDYR